MEGDVMQLVERIKERAGQSEESTTTSPSSVAPSRPRSDTIGTWLANVGVNVRKFGSKGFAGFDPKPDGEALDEAKAFVKRYLEGGRPSLYIYSVRPGERLAAGTGKTHLSVAILRAILESNPEARKQVRFCYVPEMVDDYRRQFDEASRPEDLDEKYIYPELLVMDDFGAQRLTTYAVEIINRIIYRREGRSTIYTSNLSLDEIEAKDESGYIERATSRIAGECQKLVKMTGPDRRLMRAS
jgi:DNA replication protein DnaC